MDLNMNACIWFLFGLTVLYNQKNIKLCHITYYDWEITSRFIISIFIIADEDIVMGIFKIIPAILFGFLCATCLGMIYNNTHIDLSFFFNSIECNCAENIFHSIWLVEENEMHIHCHETVSYTHLTLPTICSV